MERGERGGGEGRREREGERGESRGGETARCGWLERGWRGVGVDEGWQGPTAGSPAGSGDGSTNLVAARLLRGEKRSDAGARPRPHLGPTPSKFMRETSAPTFRSRAESKALATRHLSLATSVCASSCSSVCAGSALPVTCRHPRSEREVSVASAARAVLSRTGKTVERHLSSVAPSPSGRTSSALSSCPSPQVGASAPPASSACVSDAFVRLGKLASRGARASLSSRPASPNKPIRLSQRSALVSVPRACVSATLSAVPEAWKSSVPLGRCATLSLLSSRPGFLPCDETGFRRAARQRTLLAQ